MTFISVVREVCEAVAGLGDLARDALGHLREGVATLARLLGRLEHEVVEPVLPQTFEAELDGDELFAQAQEARGVVLVFVFVAGAGGAVGLELLVAEERREALDVAVAVGAACLGHDGVAAARLVLVGGVVGVEHARDRPEELAQSGLRGGGRGGRALEVRAPLFRAGLLLFEPGEASLGAPYLGLDLGQLRQPPADRARVALLELAELLLQGRQFGAPLVEERRHALGLGRGVGRPLARRGSLQVKAVHN
jgi:hypothetical protein